MRAMVYKEWGGPEKLELVDLPRPAVQPGTVLVRVRASSVNPIDWKLASGKLRLVMRSRVPCVPGFDVAGEVAEVGPGVAGFTVGERVHARLAGLGGGGCAEYVLAGPEVLAPIPDGLDVGEAAAMPLAGQTALQGLRDYAGLPMEGATARVLVVGASGGVGHLGVQIARAAGATVVGVCSARNAALVASLGAHEVIDYAAPDPYRGQAPFDIVLDCVGSTVGPWLPLLAPGGHLLCTTPGPALLLRSLANGLSGRKVHGVMLKSNAADLRALDGLVEAGKLRVVVDSRHPLADLRAAWERSISGRATGKIVVEVD